MSRLRITGGQAKGRVLREPVVRGVRPTSERVREALFSVIGQDLDGVRFLDACSGSGIMALEAWSRGAGVTALEVDRRVATSLRKRLEEVGADVEVRIGDARRLRDGEWDVAFADPPYALEPEPFLTALALVAHRVLIEVGPGRSPPDTINGLHLEKVRSYGDSQVWSYTRRG